jgi:hypothetical protein
MSDETDPVIATARGIRDALARYEAATDTEEREHLIQILQDELIEQWWRGLWCADGKRSQLCAADDTCRLCGKRAWQHSTRKP